MTSAPETDGPLARLTGICEKLPEALRYDSGRHARFQVRSKKFVYFLDDHHGDGIVSVCCRAAAGENQAMARADPARFYIPAYVGAHGWVALRLDTAEVDWDEVEEMVRYSYVLAAPKRLAALLR